MTTWRLPLSMMALAGTAMTVWSAPVAISTSPYMSGNSARSGFGSSMRTCTVRVSFIEMWIDNRYVATERSARVGPRRDRDLLAWLDGADVAFGHIRHHPNLRVVGDAEPDVAGLEALAVAPIAFENHAIDRRAHIRMCPARAARASPARMNASGTPRFCRRRVAPTAPPDAPLRPEGVNASSSRVPSVFCSIRSRAACIEHVLPEHRRQGTSPFLTWVPLVTGPTVSMKPSKRGATTATRRSSSCDDARRLDRAGDGLLADRDGLDAGALDLARRNFDGIAVVRSPS